jgi:hypothetical protein
VVGLALIVAGEACGSGTNRVASTVSTAVYPGPPTETLPPVVAPPRSYRPVFTGQAAVVEKAFRALLDAYERKDIAGVIALKAAPSREQELGFMSTFSIRLYRITAIAVKGNTATIDYEDAIVGRNLRSHVTTLLAQHDVWTKESGRWRAASNVASAPGIPEGLRSVTVTLRDDAPIIVPPRLPKADFAFVLRNTGAAAKGVFILGIPGRLAISAVIPLVAAVGIERQTSPIAAPLPDGILEMGATPEVPARGNGTMVFNARLPKGRYLLLSTDTRDDQRTLLPNEYAEFSIK